MKDNKEKNKKWILSTIIFIFLSIILVGGGLYLYKNNLAKNQKIPQRIQEKDLNWKQLGVDENTYYSLIDKFENNSINSNIIRIDEYFDEVGNGLYVTNIENKEYIVYMDNYGYIYGIKDVQTGSYIYAVIE